ncbi:initiation factor 2 [Xylona heveae TC161]|uniref:Translation initiation factor IF-2, mitochondrial n=1 Tax=Xylona heveae (strain CBS 132557 / TC161) TaxID=1328760 RepID=A0A161TFB1_XYLHT|nr:initiation factor 2 [Xylona heveae TC161]KZF24697.1 initiation factor 2 [Xylona heveae TC161]
MKAQRALWQKSTRQHLCVFCANRISTNGSSAANATTATPGYFARSTPSQWHNQRRHLSASSAARQQDSSEQSGGWGGMGGFGNKQSGGWGNSFSSGLSAEEERERQALRERIAKQNEASEQTQSSARPPHRPGQHHAFSGKGAYRKGASLSPEEEQEREALLNKKPYNKRGDRQSRGDKYQRDHSKQDSDTNIKGQRGRFQSEKKSRPIRIGEDRDRSSAVGDDVSSHWKHLNRRSSAATDKGRPSGALALDHLEQFEVQRHQREKVSRRGKFVGFTKKSEDAGLATEGIGGASYIEEQPEVDEPLARGNAVREGLRGYESREVEARRERERRRAEKFAKDSKPKSSAVEEESNRRRGKGKSKNREFIVNEEDWQDEVGEEEEYAPKGERKKQKKKEKQAHKAAQKAVAEPTPIMLPEYITVGNLAQAFRVRLAEFVSKMQELGFEDTQHDHILNAETAGLIAMEYNYEPIIDRGEEEDLQARPPAEDKSLLPQRPPVVTIMGHVDHGKTTLLDWLRKSSVAASEHGGITQHIGAFSVPMPSGKLITFLDTPGHAAFLSMRQRGANVTDIVILVVAADDSVKPQTIEAIKHAKSAGVPIIVAINKIDKEDAHIERVKQDLARHGVEVEDFGGDTQVVCVSGKTGQGMPELEEAAITLSEILDMRAETDGQVEGWVLEATTKKAGRVATVLVRRGTLHAGDIIVAGQTWARVRSLRNEAGVEVQAAGPGTPVEVDGWREQPVAGDEVLQAPDEQKAKSVIDFRLEKQERLKMAEDMEVINDQRKVEQEKREREKLLASGVQDGDAAAALDAAARSSSSGGIKEVFFIVKGDVSGSVEAVINSVAALGNQEVRAHILRSAVGPVSEFDIDHAAVAKGHVVSFNLPIDPHISRKAEAAGVKILDHNIIYRLVDDITSILSEHLAPSVTQRVLGEAEVAQVFDINVKSRITKPFAGCKVRNGVVARNAKIRVLRNKEVIFDGSLASLKNVKKDVTEMRKGSECGMGFENWDDFQVGDLVQAYEEKIEKRYL